MTLKFSDFQFIFINVLWKIKRNCMSGLYCKFIGGGQKEKQFFNFMNFNPYQTKIKQNISIINIKTKLFFLEMTLKLGKNRKAILLFIFVRKKIFCSKNLAVFYGFFIWFSLAFGVTVLRVLCFWCLFYKELGIHQLQQI